MGVCVGSRRLRLTTGGALSWVSGVVGRMRKWPRRAVAIVSWMMGWTRRSDRAKSNLSVIGLRRTVPTRTSALQLTLIGWVAPVLGHELSHQNGACGCGRRGSGPRSSIAPPQSGQTSSAWPVSRRVRSR